MMEQSTVFPTPALLKDGEAWREGQRKWVRVLGTQAQKSHSPGFLASALPPDNCVTLGKSANLLGYFLIWKIGTNRHNFPSKVIVKLK